MASKSGTTDNCGFCGKVKVEGEPMVVSPLNPTAMVCVSCITFFSKSLKEVAVKQFEEDFRPDEDSRSD